MTETEFRANFPQGTTVPPLLLRLLVFQNESQEFYSGHFELSDGGPSNMRAGFDGDEQAASQFAVFGQDSDGSSYGFWLYDGRTLANAPVVFLGSEGVRCTVMANTLEEFLSLLALGVDELGFAASRNDLAGPTEPLPKLVALRSWLKNEFGIVPSDNPSEIVAKARGNHPDLQAWVEAWQKSHFSYLSGDGNMAASKRRWIWLLVIALGLGAITVWGYFYFRLDPRISMEHLQGRTSAQVVAELGEPRFRIGGPPNEAEEGPLRFEYAGPFNQRYGVTFENDRVVRVVRNRK